jgi:hypothetical protein
VTARRAFDPRAILAALEQEHVAYVVVGGLARVIQGSPESTRGVDVVPSVRPENLLRLERALEQLGVTGSVAEKIGREQVVTVRTSYGELRVIGEPAGTRRGYDDLRHHATREPIGEGLRPRVASPADLVRMLSALDRAEDAERLRLMGWVAELERGRSRVIER